MTYEPDGAVVSRGELLAALAAVGLKTWAHQLHRWRDNGIFPSARLQSMGPKGMQALYPPVAVPQAAVIRQVLQLRRSLDDAGWVLWLFRFPQPSTAWVRALLRYELEEQERLLRLEYERQRSGPATDFTGVSAGDHRLPGIVRPLLKVLSQQEGELTVVLRMLAETELGLADDLEGRSGYEWGLFKDAIFAVFPVENVSDGLYRTLRLLLPVESAVPRADSIRRYLERMSPEAVKAGIVSFARWGSVPRVLEALRASGDQTLVQCRDTCLDEWRRLCAALRYPSAAILGRALFLQYLAQWHAGRRES